jgi:hypothetical protein
VLTSALRRIQWPERTFAQWFCLIGGAVLVVRGTSVLLTGPAFALPGEGWHATFHVVSGALLLAVHSRRSLAYAATAAFALAYGIVAIVGILDGHDVLGVIPVGTRDNLVHSVYVVIPLVVLAFGPARSLPARGAKALPSG